MCTVVDTDQIWAPASCMFLGVRAVGCCFLTATVPCGMCRVWSVPHLAGDWRVVNVLVAPQCLPLPFIICHPYGFNHKSMSPIHRPVPGGRREAGAHIASRGHMRPGWRVPELRGVQPGAGHCACSHTTSLVPRPLIAQRNIQI